MRCIVTGGAGFIGSNLVDKLVDDSYYYTNSQEDSYNDEIIFT